MKFKPVVLALGMFMAPCLCVAQGTIWQITLANGAVISAPSCLIAGDSLRLENDDHAQTVALSELVQLRKIKKSKFWLGSGIGLVVGAATGAIIGAASYEPPKHTPGEWDFEIWDDADANAFFGGVGGGLAGICAGGTVGLLLGKDKVYDLAKMELKEKTEICRMAGISSKRQLVLALTTFVAAPQAVVQDSIGKQVILCDKIGPVIDLEERNFYKLFQSVPNFSSAVLLQKPDSSYIFKVFEKREDRTAPSVRWIDVTAEQIVHIRNHIEPSSAK